MDEGERIDAVQRMQDHIAAHLGENITLADLARVSLFSPWYAHRLFTLYTGLSPAEYIRRLRLSRSALKLRDENIRVADVAFEMGFGSVDGYQRAFLREFGCNPREYARSPVPLRLFTPYGVKYSLTERKANVMEEVRSVYIQLIDKPARKVIIKRGVKADDYMSYCGEVGCDVWGVLVSMSSLCGEPVCMWLPEKYRKGASEYVQGVEVELDYDGAVPEGFDVIELPAAKYMLFRGEPFEEENYMRAINDLWRAMERFDPKPVGWQWDDENPRIQLEPIGSRGYMELMAVKPL